ncbi:class I SAM-dependent methyltransferase [Sphingomonas sp. VNH70]|uniref:class I SAM-dependent methyltransferase n=1 Tax=Sphingomonas silueang TaxID=3156617 RepID=UPI0032B44DD0
MTMDRSAGWEAIAERFMAVRSDMGTAPVRSWAARCLSPGAAILDIGCGSGVPIAAALAADGHALWGVDASPSLLAAFRRNLPGMPAACEPAEDSDFFGRRFPGAIAIGLLFLLDAGVQRALLARVAGALEPGGQFLFSAPCERCEWIDTLTGRPSRSLGIAAYAEALDRVGLQLVATEDDAGGNAYHAAVRVR